MHAPKSECQLKPVPLKLGWKLMLQRVRARVSVSARLARPCAGARGLPALVHINVVVQDLLHTLQDTPIPRQVVAVLVPLVHLKHGAQHVGVWLRGRLEAGGHAAARLPRLRLVLLLQPVALLAQRLDLRARARESALRGEVRGLDRQRGGRETRRTRTSRSFNRLRMTKKPFLSNCSTSSLDSGPLREPHTTGYFWRNTTHNACLTPRQTLGDSHGAALRTRSITLGSGRKREGYWSSGRGTSRTGAFVDAWCRRASMDAEGRARCATAALRIAVRRVDANISGCGSGAGGVLEGGEGFATQQFEECAQVPAPFDAAGRIFWQLLQHAIG